MRVTRNSCDDNRFLEKNEITDDNNKSLLSLSVGIKPSMFALPYGEPNNQHLRKSKPNHVIIFPIDILSFHWKLRHVSPSVTSLPYE